MERGGPWEETGRSQTQQKLSKLLSRLLRPMENWWTLQQTSTRPWGSLVFPGVPPVILRGRCLKEDQDDRNTLYGRRFNLQAAALFPDERSYRQ
ncbi:hypothetical protein GX50_07544, partial [[Emmonsia] crescens]